MSSDDAERVEAERDELAVLAAELSALATGTDYRPVRLRQMRERLAAWLDERERDHADALLVAYLMGGADRPPAPPPPETHR